MNDIRDFFLINRNKIRDSLPLLHRQCILQTGSSINRVNLSKKSDTVDVLHGSLDQQQILVKFGTDLVMKEKPKPLIRSTTSKSSWQAKERQGQKKIITCNIRAVSYIVHKNLFQLT